MQRYLPKTDYDKLKQLVGSKVIGESRIYSTFTYLRNETN